MTPMTPRTQAFFQGRKVTQNPYSIQNFIEKAGQFMEVLESELNEANKRNVENERLLEKMNSAGLKLQAERNELLEKIKSLETPPATELKIEEAPKLE